MEFNITLDIEYAVEKEEPMTRHYPGCPAQLEITKISVNDKEITNSYVWDWLMDNFGIEMEQACWENVSELRRLTQEYATRTIEEFLQDVALISDQDTMAEEVNAPTLLTLHAAKGLEFGAVFIVGLDDGVLPHQRSFDDPEAMAEERRLFYVGVTRAKDRLFLTRAFRRRLAGPSTLSEPSRFLLDLPPELVDGDLPGPHNWIETAYRQQTTWDNSLNTRSEPRYRTGMRVRHPAFGEGVVIGTQVDFDDEEVTIEFEGGRLKHLVASMANLEIIGENSG